MKRTAVVLALLLLATPAEAATIADVQKAYDAGDFATALTEVKPLAEAGDVTAMRLLGLMYREGQGVAADTDTAITWLTPAASSRRWCNVSDKHEPHGRRPRPAAAGNTGRSRHHRRCAEGL